MFVDLTNDRVHDYCKPFSAVGGEKEVGQLLFELVDVFEVGDTCNVLSFIHMNFALVHAVKCRGIFSMDWVDVESCWGKKIVH